MPRPPRLDFTDTFHHVFNRGNAKQAIFLDDEDRSFFLTKLLALKREADLLILAYCLMTNHFHLALRRGGIPLHKIMHRLLTVYAGYFNAKWAHIGHPFQGRYGNRPIMSDTDLMGVIRYVHLNPVEAGLARQPDDWPWSGHREIVHGRQELVEVDFVNGLFGGAEAYSAFVADRANNKQERIDLAALAGDHEPLLRGPLKTREATELRRDFVVEALRCGYRQSEIADYLGRTRGAISLLLTRKK